MPGEPSERFPCLVDLKQVRAAEQIWATDITYIPLQKGFLYLVAIVDLFSRNVLSWKLSNSLDTEFCFDALEMALAGGRKPKIFHSDQGCQFSSSDYVARLQAENIKISLARFHWRYCHVRPHSSLGGRTPHEVYIEIESCFSRPELTMSGTRTVQ